MKKLKLENAHIYILVGFVLLVSLILFLHFRNEQSMGEYASIEHLLEEKNGEEHSNTPSERMEEITIMIDIKGAVKRPGVYELHEGSRMYEAIELAGGFLEEANKDSVNLAQRLYDEMLIYVAFEGEEVTVSTPASSNDGKIPINRADQAMLEQLPGIGPKKAEAIVSYREEHGPFSDVDELLNVSGIGQKTLEQLKEHITLN